MRLEEKRELGNRDIMIKKQRVEIKGSGVIVCKLLHSNHLCLFFSISECLYKKYPIFQYFILVRP
jgi:hypothetical protein